MDTWHPFYMIWSFYKEYLDCGLLGYGTVRSSQCHNLEGARQSREQNVITVEEPVPQTNNNFRKLHHRHQENRNVFSPNIAKRLSLLFRYFVVINSALDHETHYPYGFQGFPNFLQADGGNSSRPRHLFSLNSQFFTHGRPSIRLCTSYSIQKVFLKNSMIERASLYTQLGFRVIAGELFRRLSEW
jgi:hypothetical protein